MLRSLRDLKGYTISANDDAIGSVNRFFFDDEQWTVRYLVVDLGSWLRARRVLLSPALVERISDDRRSIVMRLTKEQVRTSPDIETERPVSRQQERALHAHYGYGPYWGSAGLWGIGYAPAAIYASPPAPGRAEAPAAEQADSSSGDPHLRSTKEVTGYHLCTPDGEVGHVDDFVIDDESWAIRYLRVDTSNWPGGRSVVIPAAWVREVDWSRMQIRVEASAATVRQRPPLADLQRQDPAADKQSTRRVYRINRIIGKTVVTTRTAERLGIVADALLESHTQRLAGLVIAKGFMSTEHVLPLEDVETIGPDAVLVRSGDHLMNSRQWRRTDIVATRCSAITGRRVVNESGRDLGLANDLLVEEGSGALDAIEVDDRSLGGLRHRRHIVGGSPPPRIGPDVIIVAGSTA